MGKKDLVKSCVGCANLQRTVGDCVLKVRKNSGVLCGALQADGESNYCSFKDVADKADKK